MSNIINITKNISGQTLNPFSKIIVDTDVAERIQREKIVLGIVPRSGSIIVLQRNGKTANKNNGGRSFAKIVTGQDRLRRKKGADVTDYRRSAFSTPHNVPSRKTPLPLSGLPLAVELIKDKLVGKQTTIKPRSVIDILKQNMYNRTPATAMPPPVRPPKKKRVRKPKPTSTVALPVRPAMMHSNIGHLLANLGKPKKDWLASNEVRIQFPDGSTAVGTVDAAINLLKVHRKVK